MKFAPYMYALSKTHNSGGTKNVVPFQNGGQITNFYFAPFRFCQNLKNHFLKEFFFNEIWFKAYLIVTQLKKNNGQKSASETSKMREKQMLGP